MKANLLGALALTTSLAATGMARGADLANAGAFKPSIGLLTMARLGGAGLLEPLFAEEIYGTQQTRIGTSRATYAYGTSLGAAAQPKYRDSNTAFVFPVFANWELPAWGGANFLRFGAALSSSDGEDGVPVENDTTVVRASLKYLHAPSPNMLFGVGVVYDYSGVDTGLNASPIGSSTRLERRGWGGQLVYAHDFAGPWGLAAKAEYQKGKLDVDVDLGILNRVITQRNQSDDRLYLEGQLVGTYSAQQLSVIPDGWIARPVLGATFQRNFIGEVTDSTGTVKTGVAGSTENYGMVFARLGVERAMKPSPEFQVLPKASIGLDVEYANDLDTFLDDPVYGVASAGLALTAFGQRLDLAYTIHQGLDGDRRQQNFVLSTNISF